MKIALIIWLQCFFCLAYSQTKSPVSLTDRKTSASKKYFDANDPYFLEDFINDQETGRKRKLFDSLIKKGINYRVIEKDSVNNYVDSIQYWLYKDTNEVCITAQSSIKQNSMYKPKSTYIVWINKKAFYHVGFHPQKTQEFVEEFITTDKIKSIAIVTPKQEPNFCMGKTIAHIYITTKKRAKLNFFVAGFEKKQMKIGSRWVGHN